MTSDAWQVVLAAALVINALSGFGYRVYRLTLRGPIGDVYGQAVLGLLLIGLAAAVLADQGWALWASVIYALLFGVAVMPVWVLAVLIPSDPRAPDYAFTATYWILLALIAVSAIAA